MTNHSHSFASLRQDFPMLRQAMHGKPLIYLDSAATSQKPQVVIDTMTNFYQQHYATVHRAVYELAAFSTAAYQQARDSVRALLNAAKSEEIVFTSGTTESINLVASCFGKKWIKPGDEVIISVMEHHSNIVPWQMMCETYGAVLRAIPITPEGELRLDLYEKLLSDRTKLVAITHMSNVLGTINPIKTIVEMAHAHGAKVLVDGAQAVPHMPVDVQELDADFYAFSGHKAYGPTGIGILYGKEALLEELPPYKGGGDMVDVVTIEKTTYGALPTKFEAGTPLIVQAIGLGAAIQYMQAAGLKAIQAREQQLFLYAQERLSAIDGLKLIGRAEDKGAIIAFVVDGAHSLDIGTLLDTRGIAVRTGHSCAQPLMKQFGISGIVRASFGLYNTEEEIDFFIAALREVLSLLR